jgi:methionyl aminopeptidase
MTGALKSKAKRQRSPLYLTEEERDGIREAGRFNAELMDYLRPFVQPGITTGEIDRLAAKYTLDHGHRAAALGYKGFPKSLCTSINEIVCHGIPDQTVLRDGDIVNVDLTTVVQGWHGDSSETFLIGKVSDEAKRVVQVAFDSLYIGIQAIQPYGKITDIGRAIERYARSHGMEVVREYQGHGVGRDFHADPGVPHYVPRTGASQEVITPGMCFTVEPMINAGTWRTFVDPVDKWTVRTVDLSLSAQFEHTVLITETGPEITTGTKNGPQMGHRF